MVDIMSWSEEIFSLVQLKNSFRKSVTCISEIQNDSVHVCVCITLFCFIKTFEYKVTIDLNHATWHSFNKKKITREKKEEHFFF